MKLLFIFTGGTIGSTCHENIISTDEAKPKKILEAYQKRFGIDFEYDIEEPYTELSENNTGEHIRMLTECVRTNIKRGFDGIIVTHGTDTLQYSAAAIGYSVGLDSIPVCIVSANRPIENEKSNALDNLHGAIELIKNGYGNGSFVVYRNDGEKTTKIHRSTRLLAGKAFSDEVVSIYDSSYGYFDCNFNFIKNEEYEEKSDIINTLDFFNIRESSDNILVIPSYPGMSYPKLDKKTKYIIHSKR